jgi:hypothetical protein
MPVIPLNLAAAPVPSAEPAEKPVPAKIEYEPFGKILKIRFD